MKTFTYTLIYLVVSFVFFTLYSTAQDLSADFVQGEIMVKFKPGTGKKQKDDAIKDVIGENAISADNVKEFKIVPGLQKISSSLDTQKAISILEKNPNVVYAEPDYVLRADILPNDTSFNQLWGLNDVGDSNPNNDINGPEAWDIYTGSANMVIAIIDSGIDYNHSDLNDNMWKNPGEIPSDGIDNDGNGFVDDIYGYDFCNNDANPFDDNSHGTHVAGTVCAEGNNNQGVVGVNWQCKLMAVKFLCANGSGSTSAAIAAIQYANNMGVKISNNSWGGGGFSQALRDAIQNAGLTNGHIFVAASGNSGQNNDSSPHYPSAYSLSNIISVASITDDGQRSSFSNYGVNTVDLGAPGSNIYSTTPGNTYGTKSGTSMATPHVTGVVALVYGYMAQFNPNINYQSVIQTIYNNVRPLSSMNGITVTGGIVDAFASLASIPIVPQCDDGDDNDGDGLIDFPADPECTDANDNDEAPEICCLNVPSPPPSAGACANRCGQQAPSGCWCDNSCNGFGDCCTAVCSDCPSLNFCGPPPTPPPPPTPECNLTSQNACTLENNLGVPNDGETCDQSFPLECTGIPPQCDDGLDNDGDGLIDLNDPGCSGPTDNDEFNALLPQCSDTIDNDGDGAIDLVDLGCLDSNDDDEDNPSIQCDDGADNDGDGLIDFNDPGCSDATDNNEHNASVQCDDGADNDGDGKTDFPADPGCSSLTDNDELDAPPPTTPPAGACAGHCGGKAPSGCWCDNSCNGFGDCCTAVCTDCPSLNFCPASPPPTNPPPTNPPPTNPPPTNPPPTNPPPTNPPPTNPPPVGGACAGHCGGKAPSGCWCDNLCNQFGDCCSAVCTDCTTLNFCN